MQDFHLYIFVQAHVYFSHLKCTCSYALTCTPLFLLDYWNPDEPITKLLVKSIRFRIHYLWGRPPIERSQARFLPCVLKCPWAKDCTPHCSWWLLVSHPTICVFSWVKGTVALKPIEVRKVPYKCTAFLPFLTKGNEGLLRYSIFKLPDFLFLTVNDLVLH